MVRSLSIMPGEVEDEDALNAKLFALIEKNKKVKESDSMEKLMAPSYSLRSLYSDILSVKVLLDFILTELLLINSA